MLIIPFDRRLDWKRPPLITLALVALNLLAFFVWQGRDEQRMLTAVEYYYDSGLHAIELPRYRDELRSRGETAFVEQWQEHLAEPQAPWLWRMLADADFMQRLRASQVVMPQAEHYTRWQQQRAQFEARLAQVVSLRFGYTPAQPSWPSVPAHMFLHGDLGHLLGNMFFLLAVGFLVEGALGRAVYLGGYLLGGLGALGLFIAVNTGSSTPLVGASGAISALMGMYAVLFGRRRISFFYYIGVYFDYVKAPAVLLLLLWLGFELLQYFWLAPDSQVAYMAHVGGLLTGAVAAAVLLRIPGLVDRDYLAQNDRKTALAAQRATVEAHMERLDFDKALPLLKQLLVEQPQDQGLLKAAVTCARFTPAGEDYHQLAQEVFQLPQGQVEQERWVLETYRGYVSHAKPRARLPAPTVRALAGRFTHGGHFTEAERMVEVMVQHSATFTDAPAALVRLANALQRRQQGQRARHYFHMLLERFPTAPEAAVARQVLQLQPG